MVYHDSDHIIHTPAYLGGKDDNDYGNGFYTTEYEDRAKSWAALNGNPSKKAFSQIKWEGAYEVASEAGYADDDLRARREVNKFMQGRMQAILIEGYTVPGITARYAIQRKLIYHKENNYYE